MKMITGDPEKLRGTVLAYAHYRRDNGTGVFGQFATNDFLVVQRFGNYSDGEIRDWRLRLLEADLNRISGPHSFICLSTMYGGLDRRVLGFPHDEVYAGRSDGILSVVSLVPEAIHSYFSFYDAQNPAPHSPKAAKTWQELRFAPGGLGANLVKRLAVSLKAAYQAGNFEEEKMKARNFLSGSHFPWAVDALCREIEAGNTGRFAAAARTLAEKIDMVDKERYEEASGFK